MIKMKGILIFFGVILSVFVTIEAVPVAFPSTNLVSKISLVRYLSTIACNSRILIFKILFVWFDTVNQQNFVCD